MFQPEALLWDLLWRLFITSWQEVKAEGSAGLCLPAGHGAGCARSQLAVWDDSVALLKQERTVLSPQGPLRLPNLSAVRIDEKNK